MSSRGFSPLVTTDEQRFCVGVFFLGQQDSAQKTARLERTPVIREKFFVKSAAFASQRFRFGQVSYCR